MKVAVAYKPGEPLVLEELSVPETGPRDVLVRVAASGICHTDLTSINRPERETPLVPGHEACGTVEAVGADVRRVRPGDRVLASVSPACGSCWWCVNEMSNHCERGATRMVPRFDLPDGRRAPALCGCGSFAEAMVVDEASVVTVETDLPDDQLALLGCGVTTGLGAALNTARVRPGSSVAVIGCGGVGQSVVQGARIAGAATIVAVDLSAGRRTAALAAGATHAVDPAEGDSVEQVRILTRGRGVDHSFEAVGLPQLMVQAFDMARPEGTVTYIGMPPSRDAQLTLPAISAIFSGKRIQGSVVGGSQILRDFPRFIRLAESGRLDLASMVTRRITLDQVNEGLHLLEQGEGVRTVIT
ncbi:Zn-dependent alcohol dehydrogenase [Streptomyces sp. QL37]|uniref:Zn-dependent alcohol dehydrogenase n=1 Tax=Streptomyces sp. QL37 TaxID=2093747 RepID=UPI000CF21F16|nr:Zn-dependent alcohol dehydrogenase [Streptomyces sp. QL37]PPQ56408.1 alcohol dehydrogenase [Streptomyces sp. QL37]